MKCTPPVKVTQEARLINGIDRAGRLFNEEGKKSSVIQRLGGTGDLFEDAVWTGVRAETALNAVGRIDDGRGESLLPDRPLRAFFYHGTDVVLRTAGRVNNDHFIPLIFIRAL
jgi:hypothetical protein